LKNLTEKIEVKMMKKKIMTFLSAIQNLFSISSNLPPPMFINVVRLRHVGHAHGPLEKLPPPFSD
jgi:hypothetical protein